MPPFIIPNPTITSSTESADALIGNMTSDRINLLGGDDVFSALGGSDVVTGGEGNDLIDGVCGNDQLFGDEGDDTLLGGNGVDMLAGGVGADLLDGGNQADTLNGDSGADILIGDIGNDLLDGGDNDTLNGGADNDTMTGGAGDDVFVVRRGEGEDLITDFTQGADRVDLTNLGVWDVSQLSLEDTADGVRIATNEGNFVELAGLTADTLTNEDFVFVAEPEASAAITSSEGDDLLVGNMTSDRLNLLGGDDIYSALGGSDVVWGGEGNDLIDGVCGNDQLFGDEGNDILLGGNGRDMLAGGIGADLLDGGNQADTLSGDAGNDILIGDKGDDLLEGGADNDTLNGGADNDTMTGGAGDDMFVVRRGEGEDLITDFTQGEDRVDLTNLGVWDVSQLSLEDTEAGVRIATNEGNFVELAGLTADALTNEDFVLSDVPGLTVPEAGDTAAGTDAPDADEAPDMFVGSASNDRFYGDAGADNYDGGSGTDSLSYKNSDVGLTIDAQDGNNGTGMAAGDTLTSIERLSGTDFEDRIQADDGMQIDGRGGDDILLDADGKERMIGGDGADRFVLGSDGETDRISDFRIGEDVLDLSAWGVTSFDDLSIASDGKGSRIFIEYGDERLRLDRISEEDIDLFEETDFVFTQPDTLLDAILLPPLTEAEIVVPQEEEDETDVVVF